jgi:HSP20 family protein
MGECGVVRFRAENLHKEVSTMAAIERWRPRGRLRRRRPWEELTRWEEDIEDLFADFFRSVSAPLWPARHPLIETRGWAPTVDMYDRDNEIVLKVELPGMERKDIHMAVTDETLTLEGERKAEAEVKDEDYYCCERRYGKFYRAIALPTEVDASKIAAHYHNGVLEVHLPKVKEAKTRKTEVQIR